MAVARNYGSRGLYLNNPYYGGSDSIQIKYCRFHLQRWLCRCYHRLSTPGAPFSVSNDNSPVAINPVWKHLIERNLQVLEPCRGWIHSIHGLPLLFQQSHSAVFTMRIPPDPANSRYSAYRHSDRNVICWITNSIPSA